MMTPLSPGVYVFETPGGARSIEAAPTAVAIFVGETERGPEEATRINGFLDYQRIFGGYFRHAAAAPSPTAASRKLFMPYAIDGFFANGGPSAYVLRIQSRPTGGVVDAFRDLNGKAVAADGTLGAAQTARILANAPGAWGNFVGVAVLASTDGDASKFQLRVYYQRPGEADATEVERWDGLSPLPGNEKFVVDVLRRSGYVRWRATDTRVRPDDLAPPAPSTAFPFSTNGLASGAGGDTEAGIAVGDYDTFFNRLTGIDDAALIIAASEKMIPGALGATDAEYRQIAEQFITYVASQRPQTDLFFVGELPRFSGETDRVAAVTTAARDGTSPPSDFIGMYWPHIIVGDPVGAGANPTIVLPPCGHIAGLYGRTDGRRGVWKAPAGVDVRVGGALGLDYDVLAVEQDRLNPLGINALRRIPGAGLVIWGSRTREPATQWRYIPVRRTAMFLRKSIYNGIQWAVFEPNDHRLWASLRATIGAFMETQFRNGAFFGTTSREAYFVKCDEETTTDADRTAGVVNILVGFAPLRPAEFVIVRLSQIAGQQA
jgi:hypothetical protein